MRMLALPLLGADFKHMEQEVRAVEKVGTQYIRLDMMDGIFAPSTLFGMLVVVSLRSRTERVLDVHMMVEKPKRYINGIRVCGADIICVHTETCIHLDSVASRIKASGVRTGMALNPATFIHVLEQTLPQADMVLIITVNPGFGGQSFVPCTPEKVRALRVWCDSLGFTMDIEADGRISVANVRPVLETEVNVTMAGFAVFKGDAYGNVHELMELLKGYER